MPRNPRPGSAINDLMQVRDQARQRALAEVSEAVSDRETQTQRLRKLRLDRDEAEINSRRNATANVANWLAGADSAARRG